MTTAEKYKKYTIPMFGDRQFEVVSGKGCAITDSDGKKYLDFGAGIAVNSLGHANKRWADAVAPGKHSRALQQFVSDETACGFG